METIGRLARRFGLSRSTLLYYDRIGLLCPGTGGDGEYRYYSEEDAARLAQICAYREAGLSLKDIARILDSEGHGEVAAVLESRLEELGDDIKRIRHQQEVIVGLLQSDRLPNRFAELTKQTWTSLLEAAGFDGEAMRTWHVEFERQAPDRHQAFLEFLQVSPEEIAHIRSWAAGEAPDGPPGNPG